MSPRPNPFPGLRQGLMALCLVVFQPLVMTLGLGAIAASPALAQEDPPGRIGRLAEAQGSVSWWDSESGQWAQALRNRPLTSGDRIATSAGSRAEIRVGSAVVRLGATTELEVLRLDDEAISLQLHSGSLALRVRSSEVAADVDVVTREARLMPLRAGHYRVDRLDDTTSASVWRGELQIDSVNGDPLRAGQRVDLYREVRRGGGGALRVTTGPLPEDPFARWVLASEAQEERTASSRYVSPEMTGAEDLDRYGRWDSHPEFGAIWLPLDVRSDWAPYRDGRWVWVSPWGWSWVDEAPWGFAPFHYGRWVSWRGVWGWVPGAYVARPVYAPGVVAWVGGPHVGGRGQGWLPLAPRETYQPHYRVSPRYLERINEPTPNRGRAPSPRQGGPVYRNQGVPGAVTVAPPDDLDRRRQPGGRFDADPRVFTPTAPPPPRRGEPPVPTRPEVPQPPAVRGAPPLPPPAPPQAPPAPSPQPGYQPAPGRQPPAPQPMPAVPPMRPLPPAVSAAPAAPAAPVAPPPPVVHPRMSPRQPAPEPAAAPAPPAAPVAAPRVARPEPPAPTPPPAAAPAPEPERARSRDDERQPRPSPRSGAKENQR